MTKTKPTFIDLFCGAGGMSYGFEMAGFKSVLAIDNWQDALDTYNHNNPGSKTLCADLSAIDVEKTAKDFGIKHVDLIIGGGRRARVFPWREKESWMTSETNFTNPLLPL